MSVSTCSVHDFFCLPSMCLFVSITHQLVMKEPKTTNLNTFVKLFSCFLQSAVRRWIAVFITMFVFNFFRLFLQCTPYVQTLSERYEQIVNIRVVWRMTRWEVISFRSWPKTGWFPFCWENKFESNLVFHWIFILFMFTLSEGYDWIDFDIGIEFL